jgi:protein involved in polysaccharide export with SLBB domain
MLACARIIGSLSVGLGMLLCCAGCALSEAQRVRSELLTARSIGSASEDPPGEYQLGCGDVVLVRFAQQPAWNGAYRILPHGCAVLPEIGAVQLAGLTTGQAAEHLHTLAGPKAGPVSVEVLTFDSQVVYVVGEVQGGSRALPYKGPETVVELLQRAGGLTENADPTSIRIYRRFPRSNEEEMLQVNLHTILLQKDWRHNYYIQPFDRVVVPRNQWARFCDCLPGFWRRLVMRQKGNGANSIP